MRILITAGPTREPIDAVRFISNRSSGQMGLALADAAAEAGHAVTLLLGPVLMHTDLHDRCRVERFQSSQELERLLADHFGACDLLIMAAAVADYRPLNPAAGKLARHEGLTLQLEPTPDLVAAVAARKRPAQKVVAFALEESHQMESRAAEKMSRKGVDAIVANPLDAMESPDISPVLLHADGRREAPVAQAPLSKPAFARWLIRRLTQPASAPASTPTVR